MTILVVLVGMLAGLAWFLPEGESGEKSEISQTHSDPQ
jgi:beta-lactam-binding protein with PASTA domain